MKNKIPNFKEVNELLQMIHEIKAKGLEFPDFSSIHVYKDFTAVQDLAFARLSKMTYSAESITVNKGLNLTWSAIAEALEGMNKK
jgi:hypothetical protein